MREKIAVMSILLALALFLSVSTGWSWPNPAEPLPEATVAIVPDTLPQGKVRLEIDENGETMDVTVENGAIQSLKINGEAIPPADFPKYEAMVKEKMASVPPPPPPPPAPRAPGAPAPPAPPGAPGAPVPPAPPAPERVIIRKNIETIRIEEDGEEKVIVIERKSDGDDSAIWFSDEDIDIDVDEDVIIEGERVIRLRSDDVEEEVIVTSPTRGKRGVVKITTKDGEHRVIVVDENDENGRLDDLSIDPGDIERVEVIRFSGDPEVDELRLKEAMIEKEELMRQIEKENLERVIEVERIMEETREEVERNRSEIERERARMERDQVRMERDARERQREGLRFRGHDNRDWLSQQLVEDGLISAGDDYTFKLTDKRLKVNGKNQSDALHQRYMEYYERRNGITFGDGTVISVNHQN